MAGPVIKTKSESLRGKRNDNSKEAAWTEKSVREHSKKENQQVYDWFLTPEQSWDGNYNGSTAYVHSSVRNFYKNIHATGLLQSVASTIDGNTKQLQNELNKIQNQVKPKQQWRDAQILNLFRKSYIEESFDAVKEVLLRFSKNEIRKNYETFKNQGKNSKWISLTFGGKDPTIVRANEIKTQHIAVKNFKKYLLTFLNISEEDPKFAVIDSIGESFESIDWDELDKIIASDPSQQYSVTLSNGQTISLETVLEDLGNILQSITKIEGSQTSYDKLVNIQNLFQAIALGQNLWSSMGFVYEDIVSQARKDMGFQSEVKGEEELRKHNTTDIMISNFSKTIDKAKTNLGVTLKQTINFSKTSSLDYNDVKKWINVEGADTLLKQYKYFMLNYMCLSDLESKDRKMGMGSKGDRRDDNLFSHTEIVSLYQLFNRYLGRIFLIQGLLGNLLNNTTKRSFAEDGVAPVVLVTQDYALFTYDILDKMEELLQNGSLDIEIPITKTPKAHRQLVNRKAEIIKDKHSLNYTDILVDSKVNEYIHTLNKSAFGDHDINQGAQGIIKMRTTINIATIIEKVGGYNRTTNTFF